MEPEPPGPEYPSRLGLTLIALGLCFAVFLFALVCIINLFRTHLDTCILTRDIKDQTIVANAIPKIIDEFNSVSDIGWYGSCTSRTQLLDARWCT